MKRTIYLLLVTLVGFTACKKDTPSSAHQDLQYAIDEALGLIESGIEGTAQGQLAPGSKNQLQAQVDWATFIMNGSGNDDAYTNALTILNAAIDAYKNNTVKPGTPKFGVNAFFNLGSCDSLIPDKQNFTIEVKAKLTDLNTDGTAKLGAFITIDDKAKGILLRYTNTGAVAAYVFTTAYIGATTAANTVVPGQWYHLTYTYDGTTITIYVNGVKKATANVTGAPRPTIIAAGSPTRLGMSRNSEWTATYLRSMHGNLKDVRFWNRALSEAEVNSYMDKTLTNAEPGLIAYWPFDLNLGTSVPAAVGNFTAVGTNISWE